MVDGGAPRPGAGPPRGHHPSAVASTGVAAAASLADRTIPYQLVTSPHAVGYPPEFLSPSKLCHLSHKVPAASSAQTFARPSC